MAEASSVAAPCDWCLSFAGRTMKGRACCELRALALMPKARRQEVYTRVWKEDGQAVAEKLKNDVAAEYQRWVGFRDSKKSRRANINAGGNLFA